jgi:hypothetical protein
LAGPAAFLAGAAAFLAGGMAISIGRSGAAPCSLRADSSNVMALSSLTQPVGNSVENTSCATSFQPLSRAACGYCECISVARPRVGLTLRLPFQMRTPTVQCNGCPDFRRPP